MLVWPYTAKYSREPKYREEGIIYTGYKSGPCLMISKRLRRRKKLVFDHVLA